MENEVLFRAAQIQVTNIFIKIFENIHEIIK